MLCCSGIENSPWLLSDTLPSLARACRLLSALLVELMSPEKRSASVKEGVGLGFELGAAGCDGDTPTTGELAASFSARLASCCRLYSWMLVNPWRVVGGREGGTGGPSVGPSTPGGRENDGPSPEPSSPSNEDCIEVGRETGLLLVVAVLGQAFAISKPAAPRTPFKLRGCTPGKFGGVAVSFGVEVASVQNVPNVACWEQKKLCTVELLENVTAYIQKQCTDIIQSPNEYSSPHYKTFSAHSLHTFHSELTVL